MNKNKSDDKVHSKGVKNYKNCHNGIGQRHKHIMSKRN